MLILSLDTTTRGGSCALLRDDLVVREQPGDASRDQAERLPGDLAALLQRESLTLDAIDAFAVATGPGSFTALRVGIATMQGLAFATGKPLIGVSAFDALARLAGNAGREGPRRTTEDPGRTTEDPGRAPILTDAARAFTAREIGIATWIDAWRGEVFAALYEGGCEAGAPVVAPPETLLNQLRGKTTIFTGDGAALYEQQIRAALGDTARFTMPIAPALAGAVAALAGEALMAGHRPLPHAIRPIYVRRSDAELAADRLADRKGPRRM